MFNIYSNTKVTLELRDVLAMKDENGQPFDLWDFDYPSYYQGEAKKAFEQKVIDHYLFHQIGCETVARFKHNFKTRIREIMPYYLQYYKSVEVMEAIDDPFGNVDMTETFEQTSAGSASGSETGTSESTSSDQASATSSETASKTDTKTASEESERRFSNTPQGSIENLDDYMSEAAKEGKDQSETIESNGSVNVESESNTSSSTSVESSRTSSSTNEGTVTHTLHRKGNQGVNTYAHDMIEFRQSFINVDMMVIGALRDLFLLIY